MDGHHAGPAGEYLGGLVFSEFLYGRGAVGNTFRPPGVGEEYARFLQDTAHKAVERVKGTRMIRTCRGGISDGSPAPR
jgi:hypothetical protein